MPLQISVYRRDLEGVKSLLAAGADPNNTGDPQGITGDDTDSLFSFELHGVALVDILYQFEPPRYLEPRYLEPRHLGVYPLHVQEGYMDITILKIEELLRAYGASPPEGGWRQGSDEGSEDAKN